VDLYQGHLDLAEARCAVAEHRVDAALASFERARSRLTDAARTTRCVDTRLAYRQLAAHVGSSAAPLLVGPDANWFRAPGASSDVDLVDRTPPRRILLELVRARLASPGAASRNAELIAAGWPGDKARHTAVVGRLHAALSLLRRAGLRDLLLTTPSGYALDPRTGIVDAAGATHADGSGACTTR
jgi:hypothetical protein